MNPEAAYQAQITVWRLGHPVDSLFVVADDYGDLMLQVRQWGTSSYESKDL